MKPSVVAVWVGFTFVGLAEPAPVLSAFQQEVATWDRLIESKESDWRILRDQRARLFAEWKKTGDGGRGVGTLGELSWANRELIEAMVTAGSFKEAASAMTAHVDFCEKEGAGLFGRHRPNWIEFARLHARVWTELGQDPLKGRTLTYELEKDALGYHALALHDGNKDARSAEIHQITWSTFPADETSGECVLMDDLGRVTREEAVGFAYPSEKSLGNRLRARYAFSEEGGAGLLRLPVAGLLEQPRKLPR